MNEITNLRKAYDMEMKRIDPPNPTEEDNQRWDKELADTLLKNNESKEDRAFWIYMRVARGGRPVQALCKLFDISSGYYRELVRTHKDEWEKDIKEIEGNGDADFQFMLRMANDPTVSDDWFIKECGGFNRQVLTGETI